MSPPVLQQIHSAMSIMMGLEGTNEGKRVPMSMTFHPDSGQRRVTQLARNVKYFRLGLKQMGFIVYGSDDSPVVPILLYYPSKCG